MRGAVQRNELKLKWLAAATIRRLSQGTINYWEIYTYTHTRITETCDAVLFVYKIYLIELLIKTY